MILLSPQGMEQFFVGAAVENKDRWENHRHQNGVVFQLSDAVGECFTHPKIILPKKTNGKLYRL